ncbi:MAG: hypothetical protein CBC71_06185 [Rhodobacteraceae bacterium TMED111]|nr:hypothetical protein [Marinovum sp.]OUV41128.1 MAG: hypothetical protein CBC71_06185 [Rhodobacteraceae bacterium TMED111]
MIADGILSKIIRHKGDVYKVVNHGEKTQSYLVTDGVNYAHGKTLKEARDSLVYKISDRDKSAYKGKTPGDVMSKAEIIKMYRVVTGACEGGVRAFVEAQDSEKEKYKVSEIIELTKGQYGHEEFKKFIGV